MYEESLLALLTKLVRSADVDVILNVTRTMTMRMKLKTKSPRIFFFQALTFSVPQS